MKECILLNGKFSWFLKVDGEKIPFDGRDNAYYFKKHYESLGYVVSFEKEV